MSSKIGISKFNLFKLQTKKKKKKKKKKKIKFKFLQFNTEKEC